MRPNAAQINKAIYRPQKLILLDMILQRELVKQCSLCFLLWSHHHKILPLIERIESAIYPSIKEEFFNTIFSKPPPAQTRRKHILSRILPVRSPRGEGPLPQFRAGSDASASG